MIAHLPVFVATTFVMLVVPGPDFVVVTRNAVTGDRRQGYFTAVGICGGLAFLTLVTASGLAAVVAANAMMLLGLRVLGGGYLVLLGGMLLVSAWRRHQHPESDVNSPYNTRSPMVQGFLNNVLNPKALVFYLTFMPQFLISGTPVFVQTLFMGVVVVACAAIWWTLYVMAIGFLSAVLTRTSVRSAIDAGAGVALGGLGIVVLVGGL
ncbi:Threonine/homoserine/homoserine lactone efflux protein [Actinopolyspora saharensis]|uniref:Threonine/homoserine/homoserine lactone efflux protein n=2 Tax=Actinopolyspora saharensis TaxID=995062 RepID=A0A1H0YG46_9ACTN|nr:Threonine/homoserine/homoserine lactone efflux protein [Actinopolyspora saharensis]